MSNAQPEESTTVAPSDTTAPTSSRPRRPAIARPEGASAHTFLAAKAALSQAVEPISTAAYDSAAPGTPKQRYKQADAALARVEKALARASKIAADAQDAADEAGDVLDGLKKLEAGAKDIMLAEAKAAKLAKAAERAMDDVLTAQKALQAALNDRQAALDAVKAEDGDDLPADASPAMRGRHMLKSDTALVADTEEKIFRRWNGVYFEEEDEARLAHRMGKLVEQELPEKVSQRTVDDMLKYSFTMMSVEQRVPAPPADKVLIQLRNAVLEVQEDGRIFAFDPTPVFGQVNVINATLDWSSIDKTTPQPWVYTPKWPAESTQVGQYLRTIAPTTALFEYFALALGSTLVTGNKPFQKALLLLGRAGAGKGTLLKLLEYFHPKRAALPMERLRETFALEPIISTTLVTANETKYIAEEPFKEITGGDSISVNRKNKPAVTVVFKGTIVMSSNVLPAFKDEDGSIARRICALPFTNSYSKTNKAVVGWADRILGTPNELGAWLDYLLCGVSLLGARGWKWPTDAEAPPEVQNLKADVLIANDPLAGWLDEFEVTYDPTRWTAKHDIYAHYDAIMKGRAQSQRDRDRILSYDHFWKEMSTPERGFHLEKRMRKGTARVDAAHIVVTGVTARAEK
ncbi:DUF5906 domain-containing protein [Paraburkholderia tropica]|uniref:DUF5906 domain-containing protein n=1 Tax=Paraburkholderia tropica TaxID=92647 RepID=UPI0007EC5D0C|nr:DUF5906 domain-containing protein [Paraburkholderia tropica]OBR53713.1 hypothetical protein A6456_12330 [Paraburkholderia tropica]